MPRRADPELPPPVAEAVQVFGNAVRVAVLRSLASEGRATRAELLRRLDGVSEANLHAHVDLLEDAGAVVAYPARDRDPGPVTRRYSISADRVDELLDSLRSAVTPST